MYLDHRGKFIRTDLWREGKWFDFWSVVHFLSGVAMGFFPRYLRLNAFAAFAIALLALVAYEMFEVIAKIEETPQNRVMDVVVGLASFTPIYFLNPTLSLSTSVALCLIFFSAASILGAIGWHASQKAAVFERNLRAELEAARARFEERRQGRRERRAVRHARRSERRASRVARRAAKKLLK